MPFSLAIFEISPCFLGSTNTGAGSATDCAGRLGFGASPAKCASKPASITAAIAAWGSAEP